MNNSDEQLERELRQVLTARSDGPRQGDIDHLRRLAAEQPMSATPSSRRYDFARIPTWVVGAAAAVLLVVAFVAGTRVGDDDSTSSAVDEFSESLELPGGGSLAIAGQLTGFGRIVTVETADLPILPTGEFYEVWFVGAGDTEANPDRISAGTFHPDSNGQTSVSLTAAVDPTKYPILVITSEPGDGNPAPSGSEVTRGNITVIAD